MFDTKMDAFGFGIVLGLVLAFMVAVVFTTPDTIHNRACVIVEEKVLRKLSIVDSVYAGMSLLEADSIFKVADSILQECYCGDIDDLLEKYEATP